MNKRGQSRLSPFSFFRWESYDQLPSCEIDPSQIFLSRLPSSGSLPRIYGVNPRGLAEGGESINDAYWNFRKDYTKVLDDIAEDARNFDEFRLEVIRFFEDTNLPTLKEWEAAVQDVRDGRVEFRCRIASCCRRARFSRASERWVVRSTGGS